MSELEGRWYDGVSSRARAIRLRASKAGVLEGTSDDQTREWPLGAITVSPRLGSMPRVLNLPDGGRIECSDSPLLAQWFPRPASRIEHFADWLERRRTSMLIAATTIVVATIVFVQFGLPWVAARVAARIPSGVERQLSDQTVRLLDRLYTNPSRLPTARQRKLQESFRDLIEGEPRAADMRLALVDAAMIGPNAFALPDGRIFVTDALVQLAATDEQVLAVLAHEAGHHVHRHGMRQAIESSSVFLLAGLLFGDVSGSSLAVSIPAALISNRFSRGHESEADAYAFALLGRRGISPRAFAEIMRLLSTELSDGLDREGPASYLSSHPPSPVRIQAAERAAREP